MTLKRFDPVGTDGTAVIVTGTVLNSVTAGGSTPGKVLYEADAGAERSGEIGVLLDAPAADDTAAFAITNTAAAYGRVQAYMQIKQYPSAASSQLLGLRTPLGNAVRFFLGTAGQLTAQNRAGSPFGGTLATMSLNTWYRLELGCAPGTSITTGYADGGIWADDDTLIAALSPVSTGNFDGDQSSQISQASVGDVTTATSTGFKAWVTQVGFDTGATMPTIPTVDKNVDPPTYTGNFPLVYTSTGWR